MPHSNHGKFNKHQGTYLSNEYGLVKMDNYYSLKLSLFIKDTREMCVFTFGYSILQNIIILTTH